MSQKTKTFADECLERAEKATPGPKLSHSWSEDGEDHMLRDNVIGLTILCNYRHVDLYEHAATDVPELARRLQRACEVFHWLTEHDDVFIYNGKTLKKITEKLEAAPEGRRNET